MSGIGSEILLALSKCLGNGIPAALYRCPGGDIVLLADNMSGDVLSRHEFVITPWNKPFGESFRIKDTLTVSDILSSDVRPAGGMAPVALPGSTDHSSYIERVGRLIERLKIRGGKTVISRAITGEVETFEIAAIASRLFDTYTDCFCHIFYHPATGLWLGATPELLLRANRLSGRYATMSLAGTKTAGESWNQKNIEEQQIVTDFIIDVLSPLSSEIETSPRKDLKYGRISHLCTEIQGTLAPESTFEKALDVLSPTPALAGFPRKDALNDIAGIEDHERRCYGGYITIDNGAETDSFVNLRCACISGNRYTAYAGGGVTAMSDAEAEWNEASTKASHIINIINQQDKSSKNGK